MYRLFIFIKFIQYIESSLSLNYWLQKCRKSSIRDDERLESLKLLEGDIGNGQKEKIQKALKST
jgi:hypothetical protein